MLKNRCYSVSSREMPGLASEEQFSGFFVFPFLGEQ
jgi:hypothetical protein